MPRHVRWNPDTFTGRAPTSTRYRLKSSLPSSPHHLLLGIQPTSGACFRPPCHGTTPPSSFNSTFTMQRRKLGRVGMSFRLSNPKFERAPGTRPTPPNVYPPTWDPRTPAEMTGTHRCRTGTQGYPTMYDPATATPALTH